MSIFISSLQIVVLFILLVCGLLSFWIGEESAREGARLEEEVHRVQALVIITIQRIVSILIIILQILFYLFCLCVVWYLFGRRRRVGGRVCGVRRKSSACRPW